LPSVAGRLPPGACCGPLPGHVEYPFKVGFATFCARLTAARRGTLGSTVGFRRERALRPPRQALEQLFHARRILGYSYVFAFYMFGNELFREEVTPARNALNQNLFEDQQQQLEGEVRARARALRPGTRRVGPAAGPRARSVRYGAADERACAAARARAAAPASLARRRACQRPGSAACVTCAWWRERQAPSLQQRVRWPQSLASQKPKRSAGPPTGRRWSG